VFSLRGWSPRIQTECPPPYLGSTDGRGDGFRLRGCYPLWRPFPRPSTTHVLCNSLEEVQLPLSGPATPRQQRLHAVTLPRFRLTPVRSPLLRGSRLLSLPPGTEMFQFPGLPLPVLCVQTGVTRHDPCRVSPFGHPRINAWLAAPRGLSQPPTSFIGFWRLGIHRVPFVTWQLKDARARYVVLKVPGPSTRSPPCRTCRPVRGSGRASWRGARGPHGDAPSKLNSVCGRNRHLPPFPTPCGAVLGEPASGPTE
jgi:hypothetical protein